jgi:hypothetical protein
MASVHDHVPIAAGEPRKVTKQQLERKIERIEREIKEEYGFRPNISDDITGLKRHSFSSLYDPITFERDQFWPKRTLPAPVDPPEWVYPLSTINGITPPARAQRYADGGDILLNVKHKGNIYRIEKGNRAAGTRSGVHIHGSGGNTWILEGGDIALYAQGISPATFKQRQRYYMPANTPMSANNVSRSDSELMDLFVYPVGSSPITVLEPGY